MLSFILILSFGVKVLIEILLLISSKLIGNNGGEIRVFRDSIPFLPSKLGKCNTISFFLSNRGKKNGNPII